MIKLIKQILMGCIVWFVILLAHNPAVTLIVGGAFIAGLFCSWAIDGMYSARLTRLKFKAEKAIILETQRNKVSKIKASYVERLEKENETEIK